MGNQISSEDKQLLDEYKNQLFIQGQTIQQQQLQIQNLINTLSNDKTDENLKKIKRIQILQQKQAQLHKQKLKNLQNNREKPNTNTNTNMNMSIENKQKIKLDPYKILNISKNYDINMLKKAYLKKAMIHHPDKGGDPNEFKKISLAYAILQKKLKMQEYNDHNSLKSNYKRDNKLLETDNYENTKLNKDSFNLNTFNKIYEENKQNTIYDNGYGGWMKKDEINEYKPKVKITKENFNKEFDKYKHSDKNSKSISIYKPEEMISYKNADSIVTLGRDTIKDFSGESNGLLYRDLRDAYTNTTLIDINSVNENTNRDIRDYENSRENTNYKMSEKDRLLYEKYEQKQDKLEKQRLKRLEKEDETSLLLYNKLHSRLIKN